MILVYVQVNIRDSAQRKHVDARGKERKWTKNHCHGAARFACGSPILIWPTISCVGLFCSGNDSESWGDNFRVSQLCHPPTESFDCLEHFLEDHWLWLLTFVPSMHAWSIISEQFHTYFPPEFQFSVFLSFLFWLLKCFVNRLDIVGEVCFLFFLFVKALLEKNVMFSEHSGFKKECANVKR